MRNKAQSTMEYAVLISVIVIALISMGVYLKRGVQGKGRQYSDQLSGGGAYSPGATIAGSTTVKDINETSKSYSVKSGGDDEEVSISESTFQLKQSANRVEEGLPFAQEPKR